MGRQRGFTIIEVMLFVAITGLLIVMVMAGFRTSLQSNRVTDTTRTLEAFIESQYADVRTGTVVQATDSNGKIDCLGQSYPGASDSCIVMGKLLRFRTPTDIDTYNIVGNVEQSDVCAPAVNDSGASVLRRYCPRVLEMSQPIDSTSLQWSATVNSAFSSGKANFLNTAGGALTAFDNIAFMRNPTSELVYVIPFNNTQVSGLLDLDDTNSIRDFTAYTNTMGIVCIRHDIFPPLYSNVHFTGGEGAGSVESTTDDSGFGALKCN